MKRLAAAVAVCSLAGTALIGSAGAEPSEQASCVAHFVHGDAGPPGSFRSEFGGDFPLGAFGQRVSDVARAEGETFEECLASSTP